MAFRIDDNLLISKNSPRPELQTKELDGQGNFKMPRSRKLQKVLDSKVEITRGVFHKDNRRTYELPDGTAKAEQERRYPKPRSLSDDVFLGNMTYALREELCYVEGYVWHDTTLTPHAWCREFGKDYAIDHWKGDWGFEGYIGVAFDPRVLKSLIVKIRNYNQENPSFEDRDKRLEQAIESGQIVEGFREYEAMPHYESIFDALYWQVFTPEEVIPLIHKY